MRVESCETDATLGARTITCDRPVNSDARACSRGSSLLKSGGGGAGGGGSRPPSCALAGGANARTAHTIRKDRMNSAILGIHDSTLNTGFRGREGVRTDQMQ